MSRTSVELRVLEIFNLLELKYYYSFRISFRVKGKDKNNQIAGRYIIIIVEM